MASHDNPFTTPEPTHSAVDAASRGAYSTPGSGSGQNLASGNGGTLPRWQEKYPSSSSGRRKWIILGSVVGVAAVIAIAVGVGVGVSHHHNSNAGNHASTSNPNSATNPTAVNQTDPNDPSSFIKDPRLKPSLYGLAYTPSGAIPPNCTSTLADVIQDIQLMSQLTTRLRLYGSDCNQSALVLEAIKQTKVNMTVFLGNYNLPNDGGVEYSKQKQDIVAAINTYGTDHISGITVGNEFMLDYLTAAGASDPNGPVGVQGAALLIPNITDMQNTIKSLNLQKHLPVGNSDAGAFFNTQVMQAIEFGMANDHPWFGNVSIDQAAAWTYEFFQQNNVAAAANVSNHPTMYIAETGWPSNSSDAGNESNGASTASIANLQTFLNTYVCQANKNGTGYFYFEAFDEQWKDIQFGGVEGHWGLFTSNKTLKAITIPSC